MRKAEEIAKKLGLSHADYFTGTYRGVRFKINRHNNYNYLGSGGPQWDHSTWCYYIYLQQENFTPEDWLKVFETAPKTYDRSNGAKKIVRESGWLDSCDFHGGITWFKAECDPTLPEQVSLEVGCDYAHLWDMESGYRYEVDDILCDVKRTIDKLHETFAVRVWSRIDGTYHPEVEIEAYNAEAHKRLWPNEATKEAVA